MRDRLAEERRHRIPEEPVNALTGIRDVASGIENQDEVRDQRHHMLRDGLERLLVAFGRGQRGCSELLGAGGAGIQGHQAQKTGILGVAPPFHHHRLPGLRGEELPPAEPGVRGGTPFRKRKTLLRLGRWRRQVRPGRRRNQTVEQIEGDGLLQGVRRHASGPVTCRPKCAPLGWLARRPANLRSTCVPKTGRHEPPIRRLESAAAGGPPGAATILRSTIPVSLRFFDLKLLTVGACRWVAAGS